MHRSLPRVVGLVAVCLGLLWMASTAIAGVEAIKTDSVKFYMTDTAAYTYHTTDQPVRETGTVYFKFAFDQVRSGYLQGASIKFTYDPTRVTLTAARAVPEWGTVQPYLTVIPGNPTTVIFDIDPDPGTSGIPNSATPTVLAEFDFRAECQTSPINSPISVLYGANGTWVDDGIDRHIVNTRTNRIFDGHFRPWQPTWTVWLGDTFMHMEVPGALGTVIEVPIYMGGEFRMAQANLTFTYDNTKLRFVGLSALEGSITSSIVDSSVSGRVGIQLNTNESIVPRHEFHGDVMANLRFRVIGNWQGGSTDVESVNPMGFVIAQDAGTCGIPFGYWAKYPCTISIPAYLAAVTTEFTDGGKIGLTDNQVSMMIKMNNNFPAGRGWKSIITNVCLGPSLEKTGQLTYEAINFGAWTYDGANGQEVSIWAEPNSGFLPGLGTPENMVSFNIQTVAGFVPPTNFDNRFYPITYQTPFDSDPTYNALVTDTTGAAVLTHAAGNYTWDSPQVEYLMGEYFCPSVSSGSGLISQEYFTRSSFDLDDFKVKIVVTGAHNIYNVVPEAGVEIDSFDGASHKWVVLKSGVGWNTQPAGNTRVKFATITYCYWGQTQMSLSQPGPGGHWETRASSVSFVCDSAGYYFMKDPNLVNQHKVAIGGNVVSSWWVSGLPQNDLVAGTDGLPTDYALVQNYPNPFNPTTEFWYALPEGSNVEITIYNITGQKVATLVNGWREAGFYRETWNGEDLASGVYFYRLQTDQFTDSKKMILLK